MSFQDSSLTSAKLTELSKNSKTANLWRYFIEVVRIPRPSGGEKIIRDYVLKTAKEKHLICHEDEIGNILVQIPAARGYEAAPGIIFQSHLDMVPVKTPQSPIDPAIQGIILELEKNETWLKAKETSLGADNGYGIAASLALIEEKINHGPLALLFTIDEERGLKGANGLEISALNQYRYLINLDSEKEGEAIIGCAGGGDTIISFPAEKESASQKTFWKIKVSGLRGGHSGADIDKGRANAIRILAQIINLALKGSFDLNYVFFNAGIARNVIPSEAEAVIALDSKAVKNLQKIVLEQEKKLKQSFRVDDPGLSIVLEIDHNSYSEMIKSGITKRLNDLLLTLSCGVIRWSKDIEGLVETSNNLAIIKTSEKDIEITNMSRSSSNSSLEEVRQEIKSLAQSLGAKAELLAAYPGWKPKLESSIASIVKEVYKKTTDHTLIITAIHAGLECGIILEKYPHLEAISLGPTLVDVHSVREKLDLVSAGRTFDLIKEIIQKVAQA